MEVSGQSQTPAILRPASNELKAGWAPGPVWTGAENLALPPGFDPRTVQHIASRYTDWAIAAAITGVYCTKIDSFHVYVP